MARESKEAKERHGMDKHSIQRSLRGRPSRGPNLNPSSHDHDDEEGVDRRTQGMAGHGDAPALMPSPFVSFLRRLCKGLRQ